MLGFCLTFAIPQGAAMAGPGEEYYRKLEQLCRSKSQQLRDCCLASVRLARERGATRGTGKNCTILKCKGSYRFCFPAANRPGRRHSRGPKLPHEGRKRIRLFFTEFRIGESGVVERNAGKVQTDGRTTKDHIFRVKLERGRKRCRKGDPRAAVDRAQVMLGDEVVAEVKALPNNCWQRVSRYLGDGQEAQGKRLTIKGWGKRGGVVRAWLDAYPREASAPPLPRTRVLPPAKPAQQAILLPKEKIFIGPSGKVDRVLGPFDISNLDRERTRYATAFRIPNTIGKACGDEARPILVPRVELILNGKTRGGFTEIKTNCGFEEQWDLSLKLKARGTRCA